MPTTGEALLTDLYQLNMMAAYHEHGLTGVAVFELFFRRLPARRGFLVAAGLDQALNFLETIAFTADDIAAIRGLGHFHRRLPRRAEFVSLRRRCRGDAGRHGIFCRRADHPGDRTLAAGSICRNRLVNLLHFETVIASKAARMVLAAPGKALVDYGLRRAHAAEAGVLAARASYLVGFSGTATVEAGVAFGIPLYGTMAHSFVQAHDGETLAFEHFARSHPRDLVLLIDTYDTERGARRVVDLAPRLEAQGIEISGVRIDSGNLGEHAVRVRHILDEGDLDGVKIVASGGLDEDILMAFSAAGAPIDAYGIGTSLTTSPDVPALDCAYKLQEYAGRPRRKRSEGKATWPGRKQVWRRYDEMGRMTGDIVSLADERPGGEPLLRPVMRGGRRPPGGPDLTASRDLARDQLARLLPALQRLEPFDYPVDISAELRELAADLDREHGSGG
jgi:nicotinate phosphoribosyltransferase